MGVGVGIPALINSAGLFVIPMQHEFGWSRGALAIGPIVGIIYSCLNPIGGLVIDRVGARPAALIGLLVLGLLLLALAAVPAQAFAFYALLVLLGVIGTVTNNVVYCKAVATWFVRHAGTALALVLSGVSLVGAALQPALAWLIEQHGWRAGYVALAGIALLIGLPLVSAWFRENCQRVGGGRAMVQTGAAPREAMRDRRFWLIVGAFGGAALPIGGFVNQLQPLLVSKGYAPLAAATLVSGFLIATALGRLTAGFLCDHASPRMVAALCMGFAAGGAALLTHTDAATPWWLVLAAIALIGLAQGAEADFMALFALRIFGVRHFSTLFASVATIGGFAFAAGGFLFAKTFDRYGSYDAAVMASGLVFLLAAVLAATIRVPPAPGRDG